MSEVEFLRQRIKELEAEVERLTKKNNRNAGRKEKFSESDVYSMKMYKMQGKTYKDIANLYSCAESTVYRLIKEK
ncbi:hypothetical protein UMC2_35471 [[Clostridium] sordellii]|uniref:hypothetical protein n=1 Tax=Paraclostridium sordellii TaxID=1505 RepID=UPI000543BE8A|nr:hypothetical protein [Paeniclostridium sordellii]CEK34336.1 hypothetical protein UMC2_35471 [[Clostridium] sordellii] [Paeniclostridium sordellii]